LGTRRDPLLYATAATVLVAAGGPSLDMING
jgi:hypothetical protein